MISRSEDDDDDVYYYIRWRLKLEGETENMGVKLRFLVYTTSHGPRTKICAVGILAIA